MTFTAGDGSDLLEDERTVPEANRKPELKQRKPRNAAVPLGQCPACLMAVLLTEKLAEVSRDELEAVLEGDGRKLSPAESQRHQMLRERWGMARQWGRLHRRAEG